LDDELQKEWEAAQQAVAIHAEKVYREFLDRGIAKEQARVVLPEGLTPTTMHMNGTLRSWIHYWQVRCTPETQKEHRLLAEETRKMILPHFPIIREALNNDQAG
jgi:thymidylate synthase (FAD)